VIKGKWGPEYKVFSYENGLKFSKKVSIFPKMGVFSIKGFYFLRGALDAAFPFGEAWVCAQYAP